MKTIQLCLIGLLISINVLAQNLELQSNELLVQRTNGAITFDFARSDGMSIRCIQD